LLLRNPIGVDQPRHFLIVAEICGDSLSGCRFGRSPFLRRRSQHPGLGHLRARGVVERQDWAMDAPAREFGTLPG